MQLLRAEPRHIIHVWLKLNSHYAAMHAAQSSLLHWVSCLSVGSVPVCGVVLSEKHQHSQQRPTLQRLAGHMGHP